MAQSKAIRAKSIRIFTLHGVIDRPQPNTCAHRGLFATAQFIAHLRKRKQPYVSLAAALAGRGDALTIDDATYSGSQAATLARRYGHEVTLFINPGNIVAHLPHYFILLNLVVDRTHLSQITYLGKVYDLSPGNNKRIFREQLKQQLLTLAREDGRIQFVQTMARRLKVADLSIPRALQTLNLSALRRLHRLGVVLANHGWTHASLGALTVDAAREEIKQGHAWIKQQFGYDSPVYAVPFGRQLPPFSPQPDAYTQWLLNYDLLALGQIGPNIFNRDTLQLD